MKYILTPSSFNGFAILARTRPGDQLIIGRKLLENRLHTTRDREGVEAQLVRLTGHGLLKIVEDVSVPDAKRARDYLESDFREMYQSRIKRTEGLRRVRGLVVASERRAIDDTRYYLRLKALLPDGEPSVAVIDDNYPTLPTNATNWVYVKPPYFAARGIDTVGENEVKGWETVDPCHKILSEIDGRDLGREVLADIGSTIAQKPFLILLLLGGLFYLFDALRVSLADPLARGIGWLFENSPPVVLFGSMLVAGIALYFWRCRGRRTYGLFEYAVGAVGAFILVYEFEKARQLDGVLKFAAALYVMVRGLDNIGKSLKSDSWVRRWEFLFGKEYK